MDCVVYFNPVSVWILKKDLSYSIWSYLGFATTAWKIRILNLLIHQEA